MRAQVHRRQPEEQVGGAVARGREHEVAAPDAALGQRGGGAADARARLGVGVRVVLVEQPGLVGRVGDRGLEQLGDRQVRGSDALTIRKPSRGSDPLEGLGGSPGGGPGPRSNPGPARAHRTGPVTVLGSHGAGKCVQRLRHVVHGRSKRSARNLASAWACCS